MTIEYSIKDAQFHIQQVDNELILVIYSPIENKNTNCLLDDKSLKKNGIQYLKCTMKLLDTILYKMLNHDTEVDGVLS